uniref:Uncharacterized protein n=1 Tax=Aplanochytrium stocchinoi TaxID=215587 RepID=A0A7S3PG86_9STRA|mmetsp:Transcript_35907/g.44565  ORF Transcript_35907/g.44565 Transcript_35907/m.44565 type:complete len:548 (+) Transcript_35907:217-1860(+)|eukprot:CAMPEP_0204836094 /NCGR_PEP_ID=MMETSP1346-20131115/24246_1 /ASSEMBLY_ACC=CAM_ASM_000771 /TAXON_ID=215587 /ORGANISM="Aplanochytrium stocchinoi, Strain GSBS06" /LENGTH=547 /DNA_ID=CAMNT_0051970561 /DNA_START=117 /DNA_END=1763 /DNA_ORIENTATION=-
MFRKSITRGFDSASLYMKRASLGHSHTSASKGKDEKPDWKAEILNEVDQDDWKYDLIKNSKEKWRGELLCYCNQERTGLLVNSCNKTQAEILVEEQDHEPYWKLELLSEARNEWESDSILKIESQSLAECFAASEHSWLQQILFSAIADMETRISRKKKSSQHQHSNIPKRKRSSNRSKSYSQNVGQPMVLDSNRNPKDDSNKVQEQVAVQVQAQIQETTSDVGESELGLDVYAEATATTELPRDIIIDPSRVLVLAKAKTRWQALMIKLIMYTRYSFTDKADIILSLERDQALCGGKLIAEAPVWKMDFLKEVVHIKPICTWKLTFILGCPDEWRCSLMSKATSYKIAAFIYAEDTSRLKAEVMTRWMQNEQIMPRWKINLVSECVDDESLLNDVLGCREEWRAKIIVEADEDWKRGILKQEHVDQWKAKSIANEQVEWKCRMLDSRCAEKWRAQIIKGVNEEWKAELILKAQEQWRAELMENINIEWKLIYVLRAPEHWRAKMVERMNDRDQAASREMLSLDRIPDEQAAIQLFGRHGSSANLFL